MSYIGRAPANAPLTGEDITNGIITDDDINASAAIAQSKIALAITNNEIASNANIDTAKISGVAVLANDQTFTGANRGSVFTGANGVFNMTYANNFYYVPQANYTITFPSITAGQSGNIYIDNSGGYTASKSSYMKMGANDLTTLSAAGYYWMSYYAPNSSTVLITVSQALS